MARSNATSFCNRMSVAHIVPSAIDYVSALPPVPSSYAFWKFRYI